MLNQEEIDILVSNGWVMDKEIPPIFFKPDTAPYETLHGENECRAEINKILTKKSKWIVHSKGGPNQNHWEICIVKEDNAHGIQSFGGYNNGNKIRVACSGGPCQYSTSPAMWAMLLNVAEQFAKIKNGNNND